MKFYYTTSAGYDEEQKKPHNSLGGYKSNTPVPNDEYNNLFSELSVYTLSKANDEYIALMLRNDFNVEVFNVHIWFDIPETSYSIFKVAGVLPAQDCDGVYFIERTQSRTDKPLFADFVEADELNKYDLGDIAAGGQIGVWIKRELLMDYINSDTCDVYEPDPDNYRQYIPKEKEKEDIINIHLEWDDSSNP